MKFLSKYFLAAFKIDLLLPIILVLSYIVFIFIAKGAIPNTEEILEIFSSLYQKYGYEIIFVSAILEALVIVNLFVPGMMAIGLGAIFARTGQLDLTLVVLFGALGAIFGYIIDFWLGRFGFGDIFRRLGYGKILDQTKSKIVKLRSKGLILSFASPNVGGILTLAAGAAGMDFTKFFIVAGLATFFWATLGGMIVYIVGDIFIKMLLKYSFLIVLAVVLGIILLKFGKRKRLG
ncbi:MAG: VTT domain-containing protein [Candidatus Daviesbacteria bacterium]|nr:VTT domain-containing protein [Candidatus Daviesbacteria bacterium]